MEILERMPNVRTAGEKQSGETFTVALLRSVPEFDALAADWSALVGDADTTIFQTFEWQRTWWKHFCEQEPRATLHIVTVREGSRLVAVAPFFVQSLRRLGILATRRLSFIGTETTDYLDVIIARGYEEACIARIAAELAASAQEFDVLHLIDMPDRPGHHARLHAELARTGFEGKHYENEVCPRMKLLETWDKTVASFPSNKRSRIRQVQRKIAQDFTVDLSVINDANQVPAGFAEFIALHQNRWQESGHHGLFSDPRMLAFHAEVSQLCFKRGWLFLAFLSLNGERVAANYSYVFRKEVFHYSSGTNLRPELLKYSVGRVLQIYSIEELIKRGMEVYDFMRGPEEYKYYFNSFDVLNWTILMYKKNAGWAEKVYNGILLVDSLRRRIRKESLLWKTFAAENGVFSRAMMQFARKRIHTNIKEGFTKLNAPEKAIPDRKEERL
jgi:CelD/BcsL family acetyltransferase involved in cellulose biosynthesis